MLASAEQYDAEDRSDEQERGLLMEDGFETDGPVPSDRMLSKAELAGVVADVRGGYRAWLIRDASKGASVVPEWLADGFVSIPASRLPVLALPADDATIKAAVEAGYDSVGYSQRELQYEEIRAFLRRIKPGDLLLATMGDDVFVGEISGSPEQVDSPDRRSNLRRAVNWDNADSPLAVSDLSSRLVGRLATASEVVELTDVFDEVKALRPPEDDDDTVDPIAAEVVLPDLGPEATADLYVDPSVVDRVG